MKRYIRSSELLNSNMEFDYTQLDTKLHDLLVQISNCVCKKFNSIEFHYEYESKIIGTTYPTFLAILHVKPENLDVFSREIYRRDGELFCVEANIDAKHVDKDFRVEIICGATVAFKSNMTILVDYESKIQKFNKGGFDKKLQSIYNKVIKKVDSIASKMNWKLKENYQYNLVELSKEYNDENSWIELLKNLKADLNNYVDPIYEQTSEGMELQLLCGEVDKNKGIQCIPSIQLGIGSMEFYDKQENFISSMDYQDYNNEIIDIAFDSKHTSEFKNKYSKFLDSVI